MTSRTRSSEPRRTRDSRGGRCRRRPPAGAVADDRSDVAAGDARVGRTTPPATGPISAAGPLHRLLEGTVIDTVLTNRLDGARAAPVNCLVTNPVYSHSGQQVLIPAGARVLGETKPVQAFGETRLAVAFHRLSCRTAARISLDQFTGLNQIGDAGLRDQVNQHYWSTFGAAARRRPDQRARPVARHRRPGRRRRRSHRRHRRRRRRRDGAGHRQVMNRFLNRLPTITIREGHRVKVYLTSDLELPRTTSRRRRVADAS